MTETISSSAWDIGYEDDSNAHVAYGKPASADFILEHFPPNNSPNTESPVTCLIFADTQNGVADKIKPRRGVPEVCANDFFSSIVTLSTAAGPKSYFSGELNGWAGLFCLELSSIENLASRQMTKRRPKSQKKNLVWQSGVSKESPEELFTAWKAASSFDVSLKSRTKSPVSSFTCLKATLFLPHYTRDGYSPNNPGYVWHYAAAETPPLLSHGTKCIPASLSLKTADSKATKAYHFGHRYAKLHETSYDKMLYHTGVLIEYEHGNFVTIFELAWRHGVGGYRGQSNWVHDKLERPSSLLYTKMSKFLKLPWVIDKSEIRVIDLPLKNYKEFENYLEQYSGNNKRFLDPRIKEHDFVKVKNRTKTDLIKYCLNRIMFNNEYSEPVFTQKDLGFNCQTFAASFYGFLTNKNVEAFSYPKLLSGIFSFGMNNTFKKFYERKNWFATDFETKSFAAIEYEEIVAKTGRVKPTKKRTSKVNQNI